jgi:hypothetical protein
VLFEILHRIDCVLVLNITTRKKLKSQEKAKNRLRERGMNQWDSKCQNTDPLVGKILFRNQIYF